ncbi:thiamine pyrophosphate-dependent enzyme [Desulfococcaceae bacterium HSG9]|nr:thiamine pyrophosphate-dependent enzyme [Desulfococcaceae bacterium HSG9]
MPSFLNAKRPPVFCPGCSHSQVVNALDKTFQNMGLAGEQIVIVSDIGCSGLFDTFFNTHAFHGLHGRALTYAAGIKFARPDLHVIVTMGDGGLGIGGAHVLSTCRRNLDLTLLVLNNFNYGMTGGQCSATTPEEARVGSGFLNRLEKPIDACQVMGIAGAGYVTRASAYTKTLPATLEAAIRFDGFAAVDIHGVCTGRYTKQNKLTPKTIKASLEEMPSLESYSALNARKEYGRHYRETASQLKPVASPHHIETQFEPPRTDDGRSCQKSDFLEEKPDFSGRQEVVIMGSAGQRIITAGEILCLAGITAGQHASQKNDYPITVLRGHSVSELILSEEKIGYTGIETPCAVIALAQEGVNRRRAMFGHLPPETLVIKNKDVDIPSCAGKIVETDFKADRIKSQDWALAALALLAHRNMVISMDMLEAALKIRFKGKVLENVLTLVTLYRTIL